MTGVFVGVFVGDYLIGYVFCITRLAVLNHVVDGIIESILFQVYTKDQVNNLSGEQHASTGKFLSLVESILLDVYWVMVQHRSLFLVQICLKDNPIMTGCLQYLFVGVHIKLHSR